jgi:hypothetical protein
VKQQAGFYRKVTGATWWSLLFLGAGYAPMLLTGKPTLSLVVAAAMAIFVGSAARGAGSGALRGLAYGALAGMGIWMAADRLLAMSAAHQAATQAASQAASQASQPGAPATAPALPAAQARHVPLADAAVTTGACGMLCAGIGALFGHLARRRRKQIESQWQ